jgi:PAS domain S-box-containing protein
LPPGGAEPLVDLLALSYEPMLTWRLHGAIEFWNAGAERLYGFAADDAVGRSSHSLLMTKFPIGFVEFQSELIKEGHWSGELRHTCRDGHEVIVDSRMQLLGNDTVLEVNRDITEIQSLIVRQATLVRDVSAAAAKFEAVFNQSGIFRRYPGPTRLHARSEQACPGTVRIQQRAGSGQAILGYALVAWLGGDEGKDSLGDGPGCFGAAFSRRAPILAGRRQRAYRGFCNAPHS